VRLGTWSLEAGVCELELGFFVLNVVGKAGRVPALFKNWTHGPTRSKWV
jgi:hypothetical protein